MGFSDEARTVDRGGNPGQVPRGRAQSGARYYGIYINCHIMKSIFVVKPKAYAHWLPWGPASLSAVLEKAPLRGFC